MKKVLKNLIILIDKKYFVSLFFILIGIISAGLLDVLSIAILPVFISLVVQPDIFLNNISNYSNIEDYVRDFKYEKLILYASICLLILFFLKSVFQIIIIYFENLFLLKLTTDLGHKIFNDLLNKDFSFHLNVNKSVIINTLSTELDRSRFYIWALINAIKDSVLLIIFGTMLIYWIGIKIPIISIVFLGLVGASVYKFTRKNIEERGKVALKYREQQNKVVSHSLSSIKEVIVYKCQNFFTSKFDKSLKGNQIQLVYNSVFNQIPKPILEIASLIIILSIITYYVSINNSQNILGTISLLAVSLIRILPAVNSITSALLNMKFNSASVDTIISNINNIKKMNTKKIDKIINFKEINFQNVTFFYNKEKSIFNKINFKINYGTTNALIGASGSGKTTIINLFLGLIRPVEGEISFDNKNLNEEINSFRDIISYVPQNVYLMEDTLIKNIAFASNGKNIDYEKVKEVCKIAELDKFIDSLADKYETIIGEHGLNISGGQIQRIGIARALYRDPKILILDESTSALDIDTEKKILNKIIEMKLTITTLFISHRITSIKNFDNIFEVKNNKIKSINYNYLIN